MKKFKVQSFHSVRDEMIAVARGERPAPPDAAAPTFESVDLVVRLLTPENRQLLSTIRNRKPRSVTELAQMTGRAQPNLTRTLAKLEAIGLITFETVGRRKAPRVAVDKIVVEIDPCSRGDRMQLKREERALGRRIETFRDRRAGDR